VSALLDVALGVLLVVSAVGVAFARSAHPRRPARRARGFLIGGSPTYPTLRELP
jgi:hypothetical protein